MKRIFFLTVLAGLLGIASHAQNTSENNNHIKSVKAISTVCGQGRTISTVIIEYDSPIRHSSLSNSSYKVEEGEIIKVYSNSLPEAAAEGKNGPYVVIELKAETDLTASPKKSHIETPEERAERDRKQGGPGLKAGWSTGGNNIYPGNATVTQTADIKTVKGKIYKAFETPVASTEESCPLVDSFSQHKFTSPFTGQTLPYNLYLPEEYDPSISYPLVLFIHDAGAVGTDVRQTLVQGRGAVTWADPDNQARNRCIVVAPQYPFVTVDDVWNYSHHLDATVELLKDLQKRYSIDENRIYTTGQSMGCMSSIVLMLKEPDLFAGALLVAGKWNPALMEPLAKQNIWIISCDGDAHSMELQSKAIELWRQNGYKVAEAELDMEASPEEMENHVAEMLREGSHLMFTRFKGGNHRATWYVAYDIEGIQDWLFDASRNAESISFKSAKKTVLNVSVDGQPVKVDRYVDNYVKYPIRPHDQLINVYIPENATKNSPIMFYVNNGGWIANSYPDNTVLDGKDYNGTYDKVGVALKEGYVVVSYGCRSRADVPVDGRYLGHSPATMTDTKAAIRYLRYNRKALPAGDVEKIFITGTSGGGALSTLIAASGNSPDFYPSLYEIGAAGIELEKDGTYSSATGCGDNVLGVIAYCPITDLGHACAAYEWLYGDTRRIMYKNDEMNYPTIDQTSIMSASATLAEQYVEYIDGLGLKDEEGNPITSENFKEYIAGLMREEISRTINEIGTYQMMMDIEMESRGIKRVSNGWLVFNEDGSYSYDLDKHLYYVAKYTTLKPAPAFSNKGLFVTHMNEDSLFGSEGVPYCPFNEYSWNNDRVDNGVGLDETGLSWDEYMKTAQGRALALQIKMTSAIDYLLEGTSDIAPYWYVRHGMDDRDTSFAVEAILFNAVRSSGKVAEPNVGFAWLKPHSGDYDVPEAYSWLKAILGSSQSCK